MNTTETVFAFVASIGTISSICFLAIHLMVNKKKDQLGSAKFSVFESQHPTCSKCGSKKMKLKRWEIIDRTRSRFTQVYDSDDYYSKSTPSYSEQIFETGPEITEISCMECGNTLSQEVTNPVLSDSDKPIIPPKTHITFEGDYDIDFVAHIKKNPNMSTVLNESPAYKKLETEEKQMEGWKRFFMVTMIFSGAIILFLSCPISSLF